MFGVSKGCDEDGNSCQKRFRKIGHTWQHEDIETFLGYEPIPKEQFNDIDRYEFREHGFACKLPKSLRCPTEPDEFVVPGRESGSQREGSQPHVKPARQEYQNYEDSDNSLCYLYLDLEDETRIRAGDTIAKKKSN